MTISKAEIAEVMERLRKFAETAHEKENQAQEDGRIANESYYTGCHVGADYARILLENMITGSEGVTE